MASVLWVFFGGVLVAAALLVNWPRLWPDYAAIGQRTLLVLGVVAVTSGILGWISSRRRGLALAALSLPMLVFPSATASLVAAVSSSRSGFEMATALRPHLTGNTELVGVDTFVPSLNYYLGRSIRLSSSTGEPLRSNYVMHAYDSLATSHPTELRPGKWWRDALRSCSEPMIFLVQNEFPEQRELLHSAGLPVLYEDDKVAAMGPCGPSPRRIESLQGINDETISPLARGAR